MNKVYKPGECIKHMNVEMHPEMLKEWFCGNVTSEVEASGAQVVPTPDLCDPALVLWSRNMQQTFQNNSGQLTSPKEQSDRALYILQAKDAAEHIQARSLASHMSQLQALGKCKITLVLFGTRAYFKSLKASNRKTKNSKSIISITEIDLEMAITDLLVSGDCDTILVDSPIDLALHIVQFTKAIAEMPHKKAKRKLDEEAEFYMRGDNKKCITVDKDGAGMAALWQQMLGVLPASSLEAARALCASYPTPRLLIEALRAEDGAGALAELGVARAAAPGARARRLGRGLARRLHALLTADHANTLLD